MTSRLDLSGRKFNKLYVKEKLEEKDKHGQYYYLCICDCGNETKLTSNKLTRKQSPTKSCGCMKNNGGALKNILGKKNNKLTVIELLDKSKRGQRVWLAQCECGNLTEVRSNDFTSGKKKSCGCAYKSAPKKRKNYHGKRKSPEYLSWILMRNRCLNESCDDYPDYGGSGVVVCEEWKDDFQKFYSDMGPKPDKKCSIDRIDLTKGYSKDNCRWASPFIQARNRRGRRNTSSKYKSVQKEGNKWLATFSLGGVKTKRIGSYEHEDDAAAAVNLALKLVFGENCDYVYYNDTPSNENVVNTNCKFFKEIIPLLVKEKQKLYKTYDKVTKDE